MAWKRPSSGVQSRRESRSGSVATRSVPGKSRHSGPPTGRLWKLMFDKFHEECGVVAIYGHPEASKLAYLGLYALQHRGQESAGICTSDGTDVYTHKSMGHVADRKSTRLNSSHVSESRM